MVVTIRKVQMPTIMNDRWWCVQRRWRLFFFFFFDMKLWKEVQSVKHDAGNVQDKCAPGDWDNSSRHVFFFCFFLQGRVR